MHVFSGIGELTILPRQNWRAAFFGPGIPGRSRINNEGSSEPSSKRDVCYTWLAKRCHSSCAYETAGILPHIWSASSGDIEGMRTGYSKLFTE